MKHTLIFALLTLSLLLQCGQTTAGVFARGGGESRHISSVSPARVYNADRGIVTLSGHFSKHQRERRVVIAGPRLLGPIPVNVNRWSGRHISVILPTRLEAGRYQLSLQRFYRDHQPGQWVTISDPIDVTLVSGAAPVNHDGSPHAVPIRLLSRESICAQPPVHVRIAGEFFQRDGRSYNIRAQARAESLPVDRAPSPPVRVRSTTEAELALPPSFVLLHSAQIRLLYPDGSHSNWLSVAQPPCGGISESTEEHPAHVIQPAR